MPTMKLAVVVHGAPASSQAARSALRFVEAALAAGHDIHRVFFYHDAVQTANALVVAPQDEVDIGARWSEMGTRHGIELGICVAAALRRGIVDVDEAERYERRAANLREPFVILGLGQLVEAVLESDRVVTFPA
jgi:tRNA 2-thiouridine synthesizing protein D